MKGMNRGDDLVSRDDAEGLAAVLISPLQKAFTGSIAILEMRNTSARAVFATPG